MRVKAVAVGFGAVFGFLISWGQFSDPDRIREMLHLSDPYLYEMMFSAIAVAFTGVWLLRRRHARSLVTKEPITVSQERPKANHIAGAAIFGLGWAIADTCPAPVATQLTQGVGWSVFTIAGIFGGIWLFFRRQDRLVGAAVARGSDSGTAQGTRSPGLQSPRTAARRGEGSGRRRAPRDGAWHLAVSYGGLGAKRWRDRSAYPETGNLGYPKSTSDMRNLFLTFLVKKNVYIARRPKHNWERSPAGAPHLQVRFRRRCEHLNPPKGWEWEAIA